MSWMDKFPYTNFHEMNLDWILSTIRQLLQDWDAYKDEMNLKFSNLRDEFLALRQYVNDYFANLDVQEEINNKLNDMDEDGSLDAIVVPIIANWLAEHLTPTTPPVDDTLSISGAAADAKVTGDRVTELRTKAMAVSKVENLGIFEGYLQEAGNVHVPTEYKEVCTEYIPVKEGEVVKVAVTFTDYITTSGFYCFANSDGTYLRTALASATGNNAEWEVTIPAGVVGFALSFRTYGSAYTCSIYHWQPVQEAVELVPALIDGALIDWTYGVGYYNNQGEILPSTEPEHAVYTNKARVTGGSKIYYDLKINNVLKYADTEILTSYYLEWKKDGSVKRTVLPVPTLSPTRTNRKYGTLTLDADTEFLAFWWRTYNYSYEFRAFFTVDNSDLQAQLDNLGQVQDQFMSFAITPDIINDMPNMKLLADGSLRATTSRVGTSDFYPVEPGKTLHYNLSTISGDSILATYDENKVFVASVLGSGYGSYIEGDYTFGANEKYIRVNGVLTNIPTYDLVYDEYPAILTDLKRAVEAISGADNPFVKCPFISHTMINKINGENVVIPSESIFNIEMDGRLGFPIVEGNVHATSDGKFIVMHGVSNAFGSQVEHVDGTTDITATRFDAVTLEWIKTNVRYKSIYPKYRVAPPTLEEWLLACKRNGIMPFVTAATAEMAAAIEAVVGEDYIAYNGSRDWHSGLIVRYISTLTTKEDMLALCETYGPPFMLSIGNSADFSDQEISDIAALLHQHGYLIGIASCYTGEAEWQRVFNLGFDFTASGWEIPDIRNGNLCNLNSGTTFADFATTGTVADAALTLAEGQTVQPATTLPASFLSGGSLRIVFEGTIRLTFGPYIYEEYTSDGSNGMWFSTYFMDRVPTFLITATANTVIKDLTYKASKM